MTAGQSVLPFTIESAKAGSLTSYGGLPIVTELCRRLFGKQAYRSLARRLDCFGARGARRHLESLLTLLVAGGDCIEDIERLRADRGLGRLLGFPLSSRTQLKNFLYAFHQDEGGHRLTSAQDDALSRRGEAQIRPEGPALQALAAFSGDVVSAIQRARPETRATVDVDATIIEANKARALRTYEGPRGYQPQVALWAEQGLVIEDEFRDGNVPAAYGVRTFLQKAFAKLPASVTDRRLRADSALYDEAALTWADENGIQFAVTADMSEALAREVARVDPTVWKPYFGAAESADHFGSEERQWADVTTFVPGWARNHKKKGRALRYVAIRVRPRQQDLFGEESRSWRHFAIVSNLYDWDGGRLIRWHREKAGTIEHVFQEAKGELGGGTMPTGKFGANAAWWRITLLAYNLLRLLKVEALPPALQTTRPKGLRFHIFNIAGTVVRTGGRLLLRLAVSAMELARLTRARLAIAALPRPAG